MVESAKLMSSTAHQVRVVDPRCSMGGCTPTTRLKAFADSDVRLVHRPSYEELVRYLTLLLVGCGAAAKSHDNNLFESGYKLLTSGQDPEHFDYRSSKSLRLNDLRSKIATCEAAAVFLTILPYSTESLFRL
jgi:hypothetical protein